MCGVLPAALSTPPFPPKHVWHISRRAVLALAAIMALPWLLIGTLLVFWLGRESPSAADGARVEAPTSAAAVAPVPPVSPPATAAHVKRCRPGPWGDLEYTRILIEPPEDFIRINVTPVMSAQWTFPGYSPVQLAELWRTAGLPPEKIAALEANTRVLPNGCIVVVDRDFVFGLGSSERGRIYTALSHFEQNDPQANPFRFRGDAADEWFRDSGLPEKTVTLVKQLLYRRGTSLLFSDQHLVLPLLESDAERFRLIKTLARKSTLLLKLRVSANSDIDALVNYWTHGTRAKDIRPLLQSIAIGASGTTLDVTHLLPRFVRSLLYTYPLPGVETGREGVDCHWTSLNFFREQADDSFRDLNKAVATLNEEYYIAEGPPRFGDLIMFVRNGSFGVHSCIYIADDIVFTKNGSSHTMPWILMTMSDLEAYYPEDPPLRRVTYRMKGR